MKHKTVETTPLKSKKLVLHMEKPVIRKRFAPAVRVHGESGYSRKDFKNYECKET
jgi:hypothetical protein